MVRLIPKDNSFFEMFAAMSNNLIDAARALVDLFADYNNVEAKIEPNLKEVAPKAGEYKK